MNAFVSGINSDSYSVDLKEFYSYMKNLGIGYTPLLRLPKELNSYDEKVPIFVKPEYRNFGGSIKSRTFYGMYKLFELAGRLEGKQKIVAATSGNFALAGSYILPLLGGKKKIEAKMTMEKAEKTPAIKRLILENGGLVDDIYTANVCGVTGERGGKPMAAAEAEEQLDHGVVNFNQYKEYANAFAHEKTTGIEISRQTNNAVTHFVYGFGTCGTILGTGRAIRKEKPETRIIGLIPQEGHEQHGLRSRSELGEANFFLKAKELSSQIIEPVFDRQAYGSMLDLWDVGIPSGITGGTHLYGARKVAEEISRFGEGTIVTIIPDSLENYKEFLQFNLKKITGRKFSRNQYEGLREAAAKERETHIRTLRCGDNKLFEEILNSA